MNKITIGSLPTEAEIYDVQSIDQIVEKIDDNATVFKECTFNYLDENGYYISNTGKQVEHSIYHSTSKIYKSNKPIEYTNLVGINRTMCAIAAFDKDDNFISSKSIFTQDGAGSGARFPISGTYEFSDDVAYVILGIQPSWIVPTVRYYDSLDMNNLVTRLMDNVYSLNTNVDGLNANVESNNQSISNINDTLKVVRPLTYELVKFEPGYINSSGKLTTHPSLVTSENIYNCGQDVFCSGMYGANRVSYYIAAYDSNGNFLKNHSLMADVPEKTSGSGVEIGDTTYQFDDSVAYIRLTYSSTIVASKKILNCVNLIPINDAYMREIPNIIETEAQHYQQIQEDLEAGTRNHWVGKKWMAYGTSITRGALETQYPEYLANKYGLVLTNRGSSGGTISETSPESSHQSGYAEILKAILNDIESNNIQDADLVTIEGVINDWNYGRPLGDVDETIPSDPSTNLPTTVCGGLRTAIHAILTNSNATVVILTSNSGNASSYPTTHQNGLGKYQREYNDKIIEVAKFMGVHAIDVAGKCQINEYHPEYISDSVHHTELGVKQYAETVWDELRQIHCNSNLSAS